MGLMYSFELKCITVNLARRQLELDCSLVNKSEDEIDELKACYLVFRNMLDNSSEDGFVLSKSISKQVKLDALASAENYEKATIGRLNGDKPEHYVELIDIKNNQLKAIAHWRSLIEQGKL